MFDRQTWGSVDWNSPQRCACPPKHLGPHTLAPNEATRAVRSHEFSHERRITRQHEPVPIDQRATAFTHTATRGSTGCYGARLPGGQGVASSNLASPTK